MAITAWEPGGWLNAPVRVDLTDSQEPETAGASCLLQKSDSVASGLTVSLN